MFEVSFELEGKTFIARAEYNELKVYEVMLDDAGRKPLRDINPRGISLWSCRLPDSVRPGDKALCCQRTFTGCTYYITTITRVTKRTVDDIDGNKYALSTGDEWGTGGDTWERHYKSIHAYDLDFLAERVAYTKYSEYCKKQKMDKRDLIEELQKAAKKASVEQLQQALAILQVKGEKSCTRVIG